MAQIKSDATAGIAPKGTTAEAPVVLSAADNGTVHLPQGTDISSFEMTREGQNLVLTSPDGKVFVVEGYFLQADAPIIVSGTGAILSPELVHSFLKSAPEFAANTTANDESPVGEITEVTGNATVTHADGTKEALTAGTKIFEGDIVETDAKGAANIKFADDSTFAVSENARLSVDDFSFNPSDQSGSTGLSILRGVFMFTSGLVGRENPDAVHLNTPVGSIGIRGTIIGGHISADGESQISVLEGAIVVRNGIGEQILSDQFGTVKLTGFNAPIINVGPLDANTISQNYGAVRAVSPTLFTSIDDAAKDPANAQPGQPGADGQQPADAKSDAKAGADASQPQGDGASAPQGNNATPADGAKADGTAATNTPVNTPAQTAAANEPVFQALQTGSNIDSSHANTAPAAPAAPAPTTPVVVAAPPAPAAPAPATVAPQAPTTIYTPDEAPKFVGTAGITVAEGGAVALTYAHVGAQDPEGAALSYSLVSAAQKGTLQVLSGGTWNNATSFTSSDLAAGAVRYLHNGDEPGGASLSLIARDATNHTSTPQSFAINVTAVNDAPTSIELSGTAGTIDERSGTGTSGILLGGLSITDAESLSNLNTSNFTVKSFNGSSYVADTRFDVVLDNGVWTLRAKPDSSFNFETEASITLRVELNDGGATIQNANAIAITINDLNEPATNFTLNDGGAYNLGANSYAAFIQGRAAGSIIAVMTPTGDPDTTDANRTYLPADYRITSITTTAGSALVASDFEFVRIEREGRFETVLKLKDTSKINFLGVGEEVSITVVMDSKHDFVSTADDITQTFTLLGRNDTMLLESVDGKNGFHIYNDARFSNPKFGASLTVGDYNGDGRSDLIFGAPNAVNGTGENAGGVYSFSTNSAFRTEAASGEIKLSHLLGLPDSSVSQTLSGFKIELASAGDDNNKYFGASIASLPRFDNFEGPDLAVSNAANGQVNIYRNGLMTAPSTTFTNIETGVSAGQAADLMGSAMKLVAIGDTNNDGKTEFLIATQYADSHNTDAGRAYIVYGGTENAVNGNFNINTAGASRVIEIQTGTTAAGSYFGSAVAGLRDFNGDGYADFAIGAYGVDTDNTATSAAHQGRITLLMGSSSGFNTLVINGLNNGAELGKSLASGGDFNGDGKTELLFRDATAGTAGTVYALLGNSSLAGSVNLVDIPNSSSLKYGFRITTSDTGVVLGDVYGSAGDFNGDGLNDIYVDIRKDLGNGLYDHTLAIIYGKSAITDINLSTSGALNDPAQTYKIQLLGTTAEHLTVTAAGNINADGFDDLLIATSSSADAPNGEAYVVYGSNYDSVAEIVTGTTTVAASGARRFVGNDGDNILNTAGESGVSFKGGDGNDTMVISATASLKHFNGGTGTGDTIKLFFSDDEPSTPQTDFIDFRGALFDKVSHVERFVFAEGSKNDTLKLDIKDIISLGASSDSHRLIISDLTVPIGGQENALAVYNGASTVSLTSQGFIFNANSGNSTHDVVSVGDGHNYYLYTNESRGIELLVDTRLANAVNL